MHNIWHSVISEVHFVTVIHLLFKEYLETFEIDIDIGLRILELGLYQRLESISFVSFNCVALSIHFDITAQLYAQCHRFRLI